MAELKNPSLRELLAAPVAVQVGALAIEVRPMGWYQASTAIEHLLPVMAVLPLALSADETLEQQYERWMGVLVTHRQAISAFCAEASALPEAELRELAPTLLIELLLGLLEVNADFFAQSLPAVAQRAVDRLDRLKTKLGAAAAQVKAMVPSTGSTTSSSAS